MVARLKAALTVVVNYLTQNPGAAGLVAGEMVLFLARVGLNVTVNELAYIAALLLPLLTALNVAAARAQLRQFANAGQVPPQD